MVPFSLIPDLSYSRGMKKNTYTLQPAAMGSVGDAQPLDYWIMGSPIGSSVTLVMLVMPAPDLRRF